MRLLKVLLITCLDLVLESGARPSLRRGGGGSELRGGTLGDRVKYDRLLSAFYSRYVKGVVDMYRCGMKLGGCDVVGELVIRGVGSRLSQPAQNRGSVARLDSTKLAAFLMQPLKWERR